MLLICDFGASALMSGTQSRLKAAVETICATTTVVTCSPKLDTALRLF